jgi:hypothetical protein
MKITDDSMHTTSPHNPVVTKIQIPNLEKPLENELLFFFIEH